jgi:hypothetical protein
MATLQAESVVSSEKNKALADPEGGSHKSNVQGRRKICYEAKHLRKFEFQVIF